jgi:hypothetical protein
LKVQMEPTNTIVALDGVQCRVWNGVTDDNKQVFVFVHRLASREEIEGLTEKDVPRIEAKQKTVMEMFVVYDRPLDYPEHYVMRRWIIGAVEGQPIPDKDYFVIAKTLDEVRVAIPPHCVRLERDPNDEPQIVESWI